MMRLALRYLVRALIGLLALFVVILAGLTIYIRTAAFNNLLERMVNESLHGRFRGELTIGAVGASRIGRIDLHDIVFVYQGRELVRVPIVEAGYSLLPLLWHQIALTITVQRPLVHLERDPNGHWDLADALQSTRPSTGASSVYTLVAGALDLRDGRIELAPNGLHGPHYSMSAANLEARAEFSGAGLKVDARRLSAHVEAPDAPPADVTMAASYDGSSRPETIELTGLRLATQKSSLWATATVRNPKSPRIEAHITITRLAADDLTWLRGYPFRDDLAGAVDVNGPSDSLHTTVSLAAGAARAHLDADIDVTSVQPAYRGTLTLAHLNLERLVSKIKLSGLLDASAHLQGKGTQLPAIAAVVKGSGRGVMINGISVGNADLTVQVKNGNAQLSGVIASRGSQLTVNSSIDDFAAPRVHGQIVSRHLDLQTLTGSRKQPKSDINAKLALAAPRIDLAHLDLEHLDVQTSLTLAHSSLQNVVIDSGSVDARLRGGVVNLSQLRLTAAGASIGALGTIGLMPRSTTRLAYTFHAQHLAPLLQIAHAKGDGSLSLSGTADGSLLGTDARGLNTLGRAAARNLVINGVTVSTGSVTYEFQRITQGGIPLGHAQMQLSSLAAGTMHLRSFDGDARITRQNPVALTLAVKAVDSQGNTHSAGGNLAMQNGNVSGALTQLDIAAPDGRWYLGSPAHFVAGAGAVSIDRFELRSGSRELTLNGSMRSAGTQNISLTARNLDLGLVKLLLQPKQRPDGEFSGDILITGTAASPLIRVGLTGKGLAIDSQRIGDLTLQANYKPGGTSVNLALYQDRTHDMTLTGVVPMTLDWASGFHAHLGNDLALQLNSAGLRLAGLAALAPPRTIEDATGQLSFDLALRGPPLRPVANGTLALDHVGAQLPALGLKIHNSYAHLRLTPELVTLDRLAIIAGNGSITGSGSVALKSYAPGTVNLTVTIQQFPALRTERYQATLGGELHLSGTPETPDLTGRLDVLNAVMHPDLAFLTATKYRRDDTIVVIRPHEGNQSFAANPNVEQPGNAATANTAAHSSLFDNLAANVAIVIHRDTWIRHPEASVELAGHLHAVKQRRGPLTLVGEIDTMRGWIVFNHQTFTLSSGQILFTGGHKIDPSLNLDAQYTVSDYTIDVLVTGFASKPQLKLQSNPPLPQADILSLLIFGKTTSSLGQGQSASLQQQASKMAAGAAASTIGQALSSSLGLEELGFDLNGSAGNGGVGFGRYLGKNTYVSAAQSTTGRKVSIQYYIRRWLSLTTSTNSDGSSEIFLNLTRQY